MKNEKQELIQYWTESGIIAADENIINAFKTIKRENFVLDEYKEQAYDDYPLPILAGQTISQPTTVAIMTNLLEPKKNQKILEIGSGCGYQAAILGKIVGEDGKIISIEIIAKLAEFARKNLLKENIKNIEVINADGSVGYIRKAPYDRIIITAGIAEITKKLIRQLKNNGIIVAPVGNNIYCLKMTKIIKKQNNLEKKEFGTFSFVPMKGKYGFN
ncbi:MAG: protein-L-isoaspartate O-methyltransferase [Candidatus Aenigmarchaeota archaeon ex4484_52]|nr:MAG: protein-L-isoaspartate O-methyltransferase [Candidatus Aenigmarchaeota archaeon ex4484_52]